MYIKISDQGDSRIYVTLYCPGPAPSDSSILSGVPFNLDLSRDAGPGVPRDVVELDPPYPDSEIPPYPGWARLNSTEILTHYLGNRDEAHYPFVDLYDFKAALSRRGGTGKGICNRPKQIGREVVWTYVP